ncbi:hypothetical protein BS78_05G288600 [Paspalum vaginatum]|nr:hypothetical protein BS78_05G288600 [Paspalum vaginatum]
MAAAAPDDPNDEPFSPSVFLDLTPTPHPVGVGGEDLASSEDVVLPFISRMLMDDSDNDDDILYRRWRSSPSHRSSRASLRTPPLSPPRAPMSLPARPPPTPPLEEAAAPSLPHCSRRPTAPPASTAFADATWPYDPVELSQELLLSAPQSVGEEAATALFNGRVASCCIGQQFQQDGAAGAEQGRVTMDMLNLAFLKGMEEGSKFLPTSAANNGQLLSPRGSGEVADGVIIKGYEVAVAKMRGLSISSGRVMPGAGGGEEEEKAKSHGKGKGKGRQRQSSRGGNEAADLRTLLVHCAEAVSAGNRLSATELLRHTRQRSSPTGDASQRLAHCFAEGLELRLAGTVAQPKRAAASSSGVELLKAYLLYMQVCCFRMVAFKFSHMAIVKAVAAGRKKKVHIVDYGVHLGFHWLLLMGAWAASEGGPPEVRITGIDFPQPGFRPAARIEETGRRLNDFARWRGVPFKFRSIVATKWETVSADLGLLDIQPDEVLVVNGMFHFDKLMDEGASSIDNIESPSPRDMVLVNIQKMRPDLFVLCVKNSSYNAPFFVSRFREALFYYSAMFDMMETTAPRDSAERVVVEREFLGRCAVNAIACEGSERVERPETYKQWQARCSRAGLRQLPLLPSTVECLSKRVEEGYHRNFVIDEDQQWLLQGWKGRILYAMSTWAADV